MKKATKKNLKVFMTLTLLFVVSITYLMAMESFTYSVLRYAKFENELNYLNETYDKIGWTDERHEEVKATEAKGAEIAKEDSVFSWLYFSKNNEAECNRRNILIFALYVFVLLALVTIGTVSFIIISRQVYYCEKLLEKHQEVSRFVNELGIRRRIKTGFKSQEIK